MPSVVWRVLSGQPARLDELAARLFDDMAPAPHVLDAALIPREIPLVVIFNHYESARAAGWWGPLLIGRELAARRAGEQVHWIMAREWWYPGGFGRAVKQPFTHWLFARWSRVYGMILVPPILQNHLTRGEGVAGVRRALALTRGDKPPLVGIAPEGRTGPHAELCAPMPGTGLFLLLLTRDRLPCLPVGWYEDDADARITLKFGAPFYLSVPRRHERDARDRAAAEQAMAAIGKLLPEKLWGVYRQMVK